MTILCLLLSVEHYPDVRDGFKPVQRRVLYAMLREGLLHNRPYDKCAGVVGEVLKNYHPHGDGSVYDTLVRMAQPWVMRYPLIDGQGNFGSVDGDSAAAYRYTECRLTKLSEEFLRDIDEDTVDFTPNYKGKYNRTISTTCKFTWAANEWFNRDSRRHGDEHSSS